MESLKGTFSEFDSKPRQPERLSAIWTHTVLNQEGRVGVRGFGGRLMFYGTDRDRPIKVDGTLTVYAYDDTGRDPTECVPDRKFVFKHEQFAGHYSKSQLGHSYSFWIPWDEVGGLQRKVTLVCRFEPKRGGIVVSEMASQILPGRLNPDLHVSQVRRPGAAATTAPAMATPPAAAPAGAVRQVSYTEPSAAHAPPERRMSTQTIAVPPRFLGWSENADAGVAPAGGWQSVTSATHNTQTQGANPHHTPAAERQAGWVELPDEAFPALMAQAAAQQGAAARVDIVETGPQPASQIHSSRPAHPTPAMASPAAPPVAGPQETYGGLETRMGVETTMPAAGGHPPAQLSQPPRGLGGPSLFLQSRPDRSGSHRYPVRGSPAQPPGSARSLMRPRPAGWPSDHPSGPSTGANPSSPGAVPAFGQTPPSPASSAQAPWPAS
ncbi:MAG: hypothetical protein JNG90_10390 [Planctomycetaceae bacterium]|nr:hypothetical protein [Planctomycetaceae bacterium]